MVYICNMVKFTAPKYHGTFYYGNTMVFFQQGRPRPKTMFSKSVKKLVVKCYQCDCPMPNSNLHTVQQNVKFYHYTKHLKSIITIDVNKDKDTAFKAKTKATPSRPKPRPKTARCGLRLFGIRK